MKAVSSEAILHIVLERLSGVQASGNGYRAICPSHDDHNPSLSVHVGYRGILAKCWSGCSLSEICRAIGLSESDLFFDEPHSRTYKKNGTTFEKANLNWRWDWRRQTGELLAITEALAILAEEFLRQVKAVNPETLTDHQRDFLLEKISLAQSWIRLGESAGALAFDVAKIMRQEERAHV